MLKKNRFERKRMKKIHHVNGMQKKAKRVLLLLDLMGPKTRRILRDRDIYDDKWVYPWRRHSESKM